MSLLLKWYSRGRRTAWLRPVVKILAVRVMVMSSMPAKPERRRPTRRAWNRPRCAWSACDPLRQAGGWLGMYRKIYQARGVRKRYVRRNSRRRELGRARDGRACIGLAGAKGCGHRRAARSARHPRAMDFHPRAGEVGCIARDHDATLFQGGRSDQRIDQRFAHKRPQARTQGTPGVSAPQAVDAGAQL